MFFTEAQWQDVLRQQVVAAREKMAFYDAQGEPLRFHLRYHDPTMQCWSRKQREQEAEHAAISQAQIPGAARGDARRSSRALYTRDPVEGRQRVLAWRQARQAAAKGEAEGEEVMALAKQPAGMMKPPKMKMQAAPKPIKPIKVMKAPKASFKMPKPGGLTKLGGAR